MSAGLHTVHVRVNDAATGQPTPCRIRLTGPDGTYYAPFGRLTEFPTDTGADVGGNVLIDFEPHAFIDGTCEIRLPAGQLTVSISKGPEYRPLHVHVHLPPGKLTLRFELERWINLRAEQWYSGDARSHFLTPHAALLEAGAEDVAVVNLLVWQGSAGSGLGIGNILAFSGQKPALEIPGHMVVVNTMNLHHDLGRLILLNCHRAVYPLTTGGPDGLDNWTLDDWCDQCHRKQGLVVGDNFFGNYEGHPHGELLADIIRGKVDALLMDEFENPDGDAQYEQPSVLKEWYDLLDCGFRIPLVGGSGKDCNLCTLGYRRTYARLAPGEELTYKNWIEAVRAGRTFVTSGPLLFFTVNGLDPGAVIDLPSGTQGLRIRAEVRSLVPFGRLEILANRSVVASAEQKGPSYVASLEADVTLPEGGWLLARCSGAHDQKADEWIAALASPVYVRVAGQPLRPNPVIVATITGYLDMMLEWVATEARCETDRHRANLARVFQSAKEALEARLPT